MRSEEPARALQDELSLMGELRFRFSETIDPVSAVNMAAQSMWLHPPERILKVRLCLCLSPQSIRTSLPLCLSVS